MGEGEGAGADRDHPGATLGRPAQGLERLRRRRREDVEVGGHDDRIGAAQRLQATLGTTPKPVVVRSAAPSTEQVENS